MLIPNTKTKEIVEYCATNVGQPRAWIGNQLVAGDGWKLHRESPTAQWELSLEDKQIETLIGIKFG